MLPTIRLLVKSFFHVLFHRRTLCRWLCQKKHRWRQNRSSALGFCNSSIPMWLLRDVELVRALEEKAMLLVDEVVWPSFILLFGRVDGLWLQHHQYIIYWVNLHFASPLVLSLNKLILFFFHHSDHAALKKEHLYSKLHFALSACVNIYNEF